MPRIPIEQLQAGMELAADVVTPSGQCLLRRGTVADGFTAARLAARGVRTVEVAAPPPSGAMDPPDPAVQAEFERAAAEVDAWLDDRFLLAASDPRMAALRPVFRKWLLARRFAP